jgi:hypothetical protein
VKRTTTTRLIVERLPSSNNRKRLSLKPNLDPERIFGFNFRFEEVNSLKRQLRPEKTASSKKSTKEGRIAPIAFY